MEKTLIIIKPGAVQRGIIGEVISRFEKKGFIISGMKMVWLTDEILREHYSHLVDGPYFPRIKKSMEACPVILMCLRGIDVVRVARNMVGVTNGRDAQPGTIRGDFSVSISENIVHASESPEIAEIELARFFNKEEIFEYNPQLLFSLYVAQELAGEKVAD